MTGIEVVIAHALEGRYQGKFMATKIKDTPVLTGKDAERFERQIQANRFRSVPRADYDRAMKAYARIKVVS